MLYKEKASLKLRGALCKSYVRSALSTYGAKCWALKVEDEKKLKTTEMKMLQMICEKTLKDKIKNEKILEKMGVKRLEEFLREQRLRCLGHVERMDEERCPVKALHLEDLRDKRRKTEIEMERNARM